MSKQSNQNSEPPPDSAAAANVSFELSLEDTAAQRRRGVKAKGQSGGGVSGYNPYDAAPTVAPDSRTPEPPSAQSKRKPADLRKLSEWIRLQRQVEALKKQAADPTSDDQSE